MHESLGDRIAKHRTELGWTQAELAGRVGISRVALSHIESNISTPGERTVALLAGLFKVEPHELVADTNYPAAKAERLPAVAARYTEIELLLALLDNDFAWLERTDGLDERRVLDEWEARLRAVDEHFLDLRERELLRDARASVRKRRPS